MLQGAAFLAVFPEELGDSGPRRGPHLETLEPIATRAGGADAIAEVLADVGPRSPRATRRALALLPEGNGANLPALTAAARRLVLVKGDGAHDYKLSAAVLEDVHHLAPRWRGRYLAATLGLFPGAHERPNPLVDRIRAALAG
jgi:hypothetical protein